MGGKRQRGVSNFLAKPVGETKAISQGDAFPVHLVKFDTTGLIILISCTIKQQSNTVSVSLWETQRRASQPRGCGRAWKQPAGRCHWLSSVIHHYTKPAAGGLLPTNGCLTNEYACVLLGKKEEMFTSASYHAEEYYSGKSDTCDEIAVPHKQAEKIMTGNSWKQRRHPKVVVVTC